MRNIIFAIVGILLAILVIVFAVRLFSGAEDTWVCSEGSWVKHGNPSTQMPTSSCGEITNKESSPNQTEDNIIVQEPLSNSIVGVTFTVTGLARVFENQLNWKVTDTSGETLVEGAAIAQASEVGEYGNFAFTVKLPSSTPPKIILEVFDYSAKDGSVIDLSETYLNFIRSQK